MKRGTARARAPAPPLRAYRPSSAMSRGSRATRCCRPRTARCAGEPAPGAPGQATRSTAAACSLASDRIQTSVTSTLTRERFLQRLHGPEHPGLHCSLGAAGNLRYLGIRQALISRKKDRLALLGRQRGQSFLNSLLVFALLQSSIGGKFGRRRKGDQNVIRFLGLVVRFPQVVAAPVGRDREQPGREFRVTMKLVRMVAHLDKDFLSRIFSRL